jgi:hypothetical protein
MVQSTGVFMKSFALILASLITILPAHAAGDGRVDIWPSIPFIRGADLCQFRDAYGQSRTEYMQKMVRNASDLMQGGATGAEALQMLVTFDQMYDKNVALATRAQYLDVTLENTLKGYMDQYYRNLTPRAKKISFTHVNSLREIVETAKRGQRIGYFDDEQLERLDFVAYGSYALAPNCKGNIQVTVTLVGKDGQTFTYLGQGQPSVVMSQIASQIFTQFQRTQFPSNVRVGNRIVELVGGFNGSVDTATSPTMAEQACATLDARLPNQMEYELLDGYGDWSGGVSLGEGQIVWAMANNKVYHPGLRNPTPVRAPWEVNARTFKYYCVR